MIVFYTLLLNLAGLLMVNLKDTWTLDSHAWSLIIVAFGLIVVGNMFYRVRCKLILLTNEYSAGLPWVMMLLSIFSMASATLFGINFQEGDYTSIWLALILWLISFICQIIIVYKSK